jgi:pSer/pThr/pTyr-binding forkhead associated (FHA) protein
MSMGKLVVSLDGVVIKEVQIIKDKTTLGRRPYNDIVIDNLAVSGEHAVLQMVGADVFIEDLNSTNGTYINGKAVKKQLLAHNDTVEIGKYKIKYLVEEGGDYEKTMIMRPGAVQAAGAAAGGAATPPPGFSSTSGMGTNSAFGALGPQGNPASIKVLNGAAAGREVALTKVVTTVGKPGVQVASITKRPGGYVIAHVEGAHRPAINGTPLSGDSVHLKNGDVIELAGTQMQFIQS